MRHRWTITLLLMPLLLAVVALAVYRCHTVPLSQCSEVYQRYHDIPGIRASFIKDKQINDTLRLDMTLFEADDSLAFAALLKAWGRSDEFIHDIQASIVDENTRFIKRIPKGHPELPADTDNNNNEMVAIFPAKRAVAIFHTTNATQIDATMDAHFDKTVNIK